MPTTPRVDNTASPQEQAAEARRMLAEYRMPVNADNLNLAMQAIATGQPLSALNVDRVIQASMPRRGPPRGRGNNALPVPPVLPGEPAEPVPEPEQPRPLREPPASRPTAAPNGALLRQDIPNPTGARVIDENDPTAGMFESGPRAATGTPESQRELLEAVGTAVLMGLPMAALASRGGATGNLAIPNIAIPQRALPAPGGAGGGGAVGNAGANVPRVSGPTGGGGAGAQNALPEPVTVLPQGFFRGAQQQGADGLRQGMIARARQRVQAGSEPRPRVRVPAGREPAN